MRERKYRYQIAWRLLSKIFLDIKKKMFVSFFEFRNLFISKFHDNVKCTRWMKLKLISLRATFIQINFKDNLHLLHSKERFCFNSFIAPNFFLSLYIRKFSLSYLSNVLFNNLLKSHATIRNASIPLARHHYTTFRIIFPTA